MKNFKLFKSLLVLIGVLITSLTTQVWAASTVQGGEVYFDASQSGWSVSDVQFVIGHNSYSAFYNMTSIDNTNLYYISAASWDDATYFAFANGCSAWGAEGNKYADRTKWIPGKYSSAKTSFTLNSGSTYLFYTSSSGNNASISTSSPAGYLGSGKTYADLNYTQTLNQTLSTNGGSTYSASTLSLATVTVSSYKLDGADSSTEDEGTIEEGESSTTCKAARSATVTYSVSGVATGYDFVGWYDGSTQKSTSTSYSYTSTGTKTITARFKQKQYTVSYGVYASSRWGSMKLNSGSSVSTTASSTLNHGTTLSFTATPNSGYQVEGWYSDAACAVKDRLQEGGTSYNGGTLTAATTVYVKFKVRTGGTITLSAGANGEVSADNSAWGSTKTITDVTSATDVSIYARGNTGYQFSSWTKSSGSGTVKTNAASGVFTTVAYEDATVTASFSEVMSSLSTSCHYDAGNPSYAAPTVSGSATTVGYTTTRSITAASSSTGYIFVGWTLTNCTRTDAGGETATSITVRSNGDGEDATVVANYEEVLTSRWHLVGENVTSKVTYPDGWNVSNTSMMQKATGHSTESVVYADVTVSNASGTYEFKVVDDNGASDDIWYGYSSDGSGNQWLIWTGTSTKTVYTGSNNDHNLKFTPTVAGTYVFKVDYSGTYPTVTITYPTSYTLTYSIGSVAGNNGSISTSPTTASGSKVLSGNTVTLTGPAAKTGYTWKGWYTNPGGTTGKIDDTNRAITVTMNADKTMYACYTENDYTVTVAAGDHGSVASTSVTGHKDSKVTLPTATADPGYRFVNWTTTAGTLTNANSATTGQINGITATVTVTANFEPIWRIACSDDSYSTTSKQITNITTSAGVMTSGYVEATLAANTDYQFKVYQAGDANPYWGKTSTITQITYANKATAVALTHNDGNNQTFKTAAAGTYRFTWDVTNSKITLGYPTSWQITIGQKSIYDPNVTNTSDATTTGGNVTAVDNSSNIITTAKYVANSASVTFTAHPADGYAFKGWYQNADCSTPYTAGSNVAIDNEAKTLTLSSITANKAVYAKFEEIMSYVSISSSRGTFKIDNGSAISRYGTPFLQVGVKTKHTVTIVSENDGYYFSGWDLHTSDENVLNTSISGSGEDDRTITVSGLGHASEHILDFLSPEFGDLDQIYFRNVFDDGTNPATHWSNVYVHFDISWTEYEGEQAAKTSNEDIYDKLHVQMTEIGTSHIFKAYVPRFVTRYNKSNVAFANSEDSYRNSKLWTGSASSRGDYNKLHNMFVPNHTKSYDCNGVAYYNSGYWMHYTISEGEYGGYWIEERTGSSEYSGKATAPQFVILKRAYDTKPQIQCRLRIDGPSRSKYAIFSEGGIKYKAGSTITSGACTDVNVVEDNGSDAYFTLTPTAEGEYVITIDQSGDQMKISVNYPIAVGDYVLENTYKGKKKTNPAVDSTYTTRSNIIKEEVAGDSARYSMYIGVADGTLKLYKCTEISLAGVPTWTLCDNAATGGSELAKIWSKVGSKPGVYQFDLEVNTSTDKVSQVYEDSVRLYTGDYYIKTDAASGGWVAYKNNKMDKNTVNFDRTSATFDNYWCHYYASRDQNIKCVIANDYCNQLSDTLKEDAIARVDGTEPYVPVDGTSIRFSYNSATNTIGRAYLEASLQKDYLNIVPKASSQVYRIYEEVKSDLYNMTGDNLWKSRFVDSGDWVYEIDLKVKPGAQAGVQATFTDASSVDHVQTFLPLDNVVLGCKAEETCTGEYDIRVVYDFKTNFMMSAFILTGDEITENLADFDMLWVRHKDESAAQLTLGEDIALTDVRVVGAIEFKYNEMCWNATSPVDLGSWNAESRPYLKYFVSFPFDVEVNSIFGLNQADYGRYGDFVIQKYNGAARAKEGLFFGDGDNYWEDVALGDTLFANEGYCVILDNDYARMAGSYDMWHNKSAGSSVFLYFPAMKAIESITNEETTSSVASHECTINRPWTSSISGKEKNHMNTDSHWNVIGSPLFHDSYIKDTTASSPYYLSSFYNLNYSTNKWEPLATKDYPMFKAMSSRLVQWYGTITWTVNSEDNLYAAPRRATDEDKKNYFAKLEVAYNGKVSDWTYVEMSEAADTAFVLREDMYKLYNSGIPQIYTFAGAYDVAYNKVPVETQTIPMGVIVRKNGTYTFSMPTNFSGTVTLIDTYAQTRTNLGLEDYVVELQKGTIDDRFLLEFDIHKSPTAIDGVTDGSSSLKDGKVHKFIMNDQLYILKDGVIYDARGARVQ